MRTFLPIGLAIAACALAGCGRSSVPPPAATSTERAARRAFSGAPPVIPHRPLSGKCVSCHTTTGAVVPTLGAAPANPHSRTSGMSESSRCRQCHVFQQTGELFRESELATLLPERRRGERAHAFAPPTTPHPLWMRDDCAACHAGPSARPEIVCRHSDRQRCLQCHVPQSAVASFSD